MPTTDEPGAYRLLRTITVGSASYVEVDLRSASYAGATDGVAQNADGDQRGILKSIALLNNSTTAAERVRVAFYVSAGSPTPAEAYNVVIPNGPSVELRCSSHPNVTRFYLKSESGSPEIQMEMWYDVPPAS
tara:strand:- start:15632 stop:16027 length:396 start_codon:yes stop_codon:yes gene_type:complete